MTADESTTVPAALQELVDAARRDPAAAADILQDGADTPDPVVQARLAAVILGAALAALDDYDAFVRSRITSTTPDGPGDQETDYRRWLGMAIGRLETARCILGEAAAQPGEGPLLWVMSSEVARLAHGTIQDIIVPASGTREDRERLTAITTTMTALRGHPLNARSDQAARQVARERLGVA